MYYNNTGYTQTLSLSLSLCFCARPRAIASLAFVIFFLSPAKKNRAYVRTCINYTRRTVFRFLSRGCVEWCVEGSGERYVCFLTHFVQKRPIGLGIKNNLGSLLFNRLSRSLFLVFCFLLPFLSLLPLIIFLSSSAQTRALFSLCIIYNNIYTHTRTARLDEPFFLSLSLFAKKISLDI